MQKIIWCLIIATLVLAGCRKMVLREVDTDFSDEHCSNGILDADEIGEDCGGEDCAACVQTSAPCTLDSNTIYGFVNGPFLNDYPFIDHELDTTTDSFWRFKAWTNATNYLYLRFNQRPDVETVYMGTSDGISLEDYEVFVTYYQAYPNDDLLGSGNVYVNYANNKFTISSCDFGFHPYGSSTPSTTQSFSVTF